jgi:hypothetical protein
MISFLNPTVLFALAAASIPLLIHLFNRRKVKTVNFSTIQFLKKLEKKQIRNLKIRQLLLLILRMLIIIFIVLAFARPTRQVSSKGLLANRSPIDAFIILDNSLSLNEVQMSGSLVQKLKAGFNELETVFHAGDRISIVQSTIPQKELIIDENFQSNIWERVGQKIQPNYLKSDLIAAIRKGVEKLSRSPFFNREIYILSDFQKSALNPIEVRVSIKNIDTDNIRVISIPFKHTNLDNISVEKVEVVNRLIEKNQPLHLNVYLKNHHPGKFLTTMVSVLLNGTRVAQQNINIEPDKLIETSFQVTLIEENFVKGLIEIETDAISEDNKRYFNFYVPNKISVLHFIKSEEKPTYIPLILQPAISRGIFNYKTDNILKWTNYNFADFDMLIIEGLDQIPLNLIQRLKTFTSQGGGVFIIPGDQIIPSSYQKAFKELALGSIMDLRGTPGDHNQFLSLRKFRWSHSIFEGLFDEQKREINPIEVYVSYRIKPAAQSETLISLSDNSPFLLMSQLDRGIAITISSALQPGWTSLPIKGFVVPLLYRIIYYSGTRKIEDRKLVKCGESFQQIFWNLEPPFDFQLVDLFGHEVKLTPNFKGSKILLETEDLEIPGNYQILQQEKVLSTFSVNAWTEESNVMRHEAKLLREIIPNMIYIDDFDSISSKIMETRFGREYWSYFLLIALFLLIFEMIVARTSSKKMLIKSKISKEVV